MRCVWSLACCSHSSDNWKASAPACLNLTIPSHAIDQAILLTQWKFLVQQLGCFVPWVPVPQIENAPLDWHFSIRVKLPSANIIFQNCCKNLRCLKPCATAKPEDWPGGLQPRCPCSLLRPFPSVSWSCPTSTWIVGSYRPWKTLYGPIWHPAPHVKGYGDQRTLLTACILLKATKFFGSDHLLPITILWRFVCLAKTL